jgi:ankyrin repeat protein
MIHILITIAAVLLFGCDNSKKSVPQTETVEPIAEVQKQQSNTQSETKGVTQFKKPAKTLHTASQEGDIEAVKNFLNAGADVNEKSERGMTPLQYAVTSGDTYNIPSDSPLIKAIELLVENGANVNLIDNEGNTPLDYAVFRSDEISNILRKHEAKRSTEINVTTKATEISLWEAAMFGEIATIEKRLSEGADVNGKNDEGDAPLHLAVVAALDSGSNKAIELLIENGADVNLISDRKGMTPLDIVKILSGPAAITKKIREIQGKTDDISVADLLRQNGGKTSKELNINLLEKSEKLKGIEVPDSNLMQKFWFAYPYQPEPGYRLWELTDKGIWIENYPSGLKSEFKIIDRTKIDGISGEYAIKVKGDPRKTNTENGDFRVFIPDFRTADSFIYMSRKTLGSWQGWEKSDYLIKVISTRDGKKFRSVHGAVITNDLNWLKQLLDDGENINAKDKSGMTPLDYAKNDIAKLLYSRGGKTMDQLKLDEKKLIQAARGGDIKSLKNYLSNGVDVNAKDEDSHVSLHWNVNDDILRVLIASGANVNALNKYGRTPLDFAIVRDKKTAIKTLIKHGGKTAEELKAEGK